MTRSARTLPAKTLTAKAARKVRGGAEAQKPAPQEKHKGWIDIESFSWGVSQH